MAHHKQYPVAFAEYRRTIGDIDAALRAAKVPPALRAEVSVAVARAWCAGQDSVAEEQANARGKD